MTVFGAIGNLNERKYQIAIIGTLVQEGLYECKTVTVELLNKSGKALRDVFRETFGEEWYFVIRHE
jgi:hypothetical protein